MSWRGWGEMMGFDRDDELQSLPPLKPLGPEVEATEVAEDLGDALEEDSLAELPPKRPPAALKRTELGGPPLTAQGRVPHPAELDHTELGLTEYELTEMLRASSGPRTREVIRPPEPFTRGIPAPPQLTPLGDEEAPTEALNEVELGAPEPEEGDMFVFDEQAHDVGIIPDDDLAEATMELSLDLDQGPDTVLSSRHPGGLRSTFTPPISPAPPMPAPAAAPAQDTDWKGLHPASLLVNLIPRTWRTLLSLWPLFLAMIVGGQSLNASLGEGLFLMLFLATGAWSTVVHFMTLRYRVHGGKLEIKQGLLNRQARSIDPARIQNIALIRNPFHSLSGLVELRIETAGGTRTEGMLSALSVAEANALMAALKGARGQESESEEDAQETELLKLGIGELLAYGLSSGSAGLVALLLVGGFELLTVLDPQQAGSELSNLPVTRMGALVLLAFAVSWAASAVLSVVRHYGFTLRRKGHPASDQVQLASKEGLLTRKAVEVPLRKVQLVMADEPLVRRWMGFGTLQVETAGLGSVKDGVAAAELVIPMVDRDELGPLTGAAIPRAEIDPWQTKLRPAHPRALYRACMAGSMRALLFSVPVVALAWPVGLAALTLLPLALLTAWLDWRYQGWLITDSVVVARRGFWRRRTWLLARDKLQSVHLVQGPLMRAHGLGRLVVKVAGSRVVLPDVAYGEGQDLLDELRPAASPY